ncbi:MAG: reactive intermediate/imine deaminase [Actinomycetes bacterium]|nr:MAG: reactive intermediate/imine deaminase [Actinomycetes bacterium]
MAERRTVEAIGAPEAAGPYSHAVAHGDVLYCSGQVPIDPDTGRLVEAGPGEQAARCLENLEVVCAAAGTSLDRALMVTVYVTNLAAGAEVNAAYAERFATGPPARAMVEVAGLPLGASVEIAAAVALG